MAQKTIYKSDNDNYNPFHEEMMKLCLQLAKCAQGQTAPNPMVGAVIVKEGKIIAQGYHHGAGNPHAEVEALKQAGEEAEGATIYVNLEPCNHYGRTPPCTEALIAAKVGKVVVGMIDPDPRVAGGGVERLTQAGIEVIVGVEESLCRQLNEAFIHRIVHQRPLGILKYAMTLDGKIATTSGHSAWVTGVESRNYVHHLRSTCDGVIIGGNTARLDNPYLTTHGVTKHNPCRVVMSRSLDLPKVAHLWDTELASTLVFTTVGANLELQKHLKSLGVEVVELANLTPVAVMNDLYHRGFLSVLWECGGNLGASAIASGMVQKIIAFIAPKIIGGKNAPSPIGDLGLVKMTDALTLAKANFQKIGEDFMIEGYFG